MKTHIKKPTEKSIIKATIRAIPLVLTIIMLVVHLAAPNSIPPPQPFFYEGYGAIVLSNAWVIVLAILGISLLAINILSFFFTRISRILQKYAPIATATLAIIFLYDIITLHLALLNTMFFPWPERIVYAIISDISVLSVAIGNSLGLLLLGYAVGSLLGIICGVVSGFMARVRYWVRPVARLLSSIPIVTIVPILVFVQVSFFARAILLISIAVWVPVTLTIQNGVMAIPKSTFEAARTFGIKNIGLIYKVALPASSPSVFAGLAQGMATACVALIIAETMGVSAGIGHYIGQQSQFVNSPALFGAVIILSAMFAVVNLAINIASKFVLRWKSEGNG